MKKTLLCLILHFSSFLLLIHAQCPDFTNLNSSNVICQYGSFWNPFQYTGIANRRHTVIDYQGTDPNTNYQLPFLPPGETTVVRLGNEYVGAEAEAITYQFTVDSDYSILFLKFAVVFEDPGHPYPDQPRFVVRVLDSSGELVDDCAEYDVTAAGNIPGFHTYRRSWSIVRWRPWTNVGIDLSDYAGQSIQVQFVTYDCALYGHYSYAYFTASCISNRLSLSACTGDQITLVAPSGFETYAWDNGSTDTTATYTINDNTVANCYITSATGCSFTLSGTITTDDEVPLSSSIIYDTICEGDTYNQNFFNLSPQFEVGTQIFRNTFFDPINCSDESITTTLFLTVVPRYYDIFDEVCQGSDYHAYGFHYTNLQTGSYVDTLVTTLPTGCDLISILHLTVAPSFVLNNLITGETSVCSNEVYTYSLQSTNGLASYYWNVPDGVNILYGQGTTEVNLYFTNDAPNPAIISLTGSNGCGSGSVPLSVTHYPSYHLFFQDTLCTGNEYHRNGFNLARQDSIGWFVFNNRHTTTQGCDSVQILQLLVAGTPNLTSIVLPSEICIGGMSNVFALGENAAIIVPSPSVSVGDILCTDNSIVKPSAWPVPGKTAKGIVFYVDNTDEHGWAVHLQDQANSIAWGGWTIDIPSLPNYTNDRVAITDIDGFTNTQRIRAAGNASTYPAAYAVDFNNGWYLPSMGQLSLLYSEIVAVNASLQLVGGTLFYMNSAWVYWSSTEFNPYNVYGIYCNGDLFRVGKTENHSVRSICDF